MEWYWFLTSAQQKGLQFPNHIPLKLTVDNFSFDPNDWKSQPTSLKTTKWTWTISFSVMPMSFLQLFLISKDRICSLVFKKAFKWVARSCTKWMVLDHPLAFGKIKLQIVVQHLFSFFPLCAKIVSRLLCLCTSL